MRTRQRPDKCVPRERDDSDSARAPQFGVVIGVSLLGACRMRFQQGTGAARETCALELAPRSAYVLEGAVRWQWQHSIPPTKSPRYSVTFRTLRGDRATHDSPR